MERAITCTSLVKSFGEPPLTVLKSLNFEIARGEFVSITGRSGSGKSTLLYLVSSLDVPTSGEITIAGKNVHAMGHREIHGFRNRHIGFVFQFHYLLPELTALENVLMPARKTGVHRRKTERAHELLKEFDVYHCRDKTPAKMSGGEMQRVAIARSLILEPDFLFADEPTGNLDSVNGAKVIEIFKDINKTRGTTILMVTHERDYAAMATRRMNLVDGRIESDSADEKPAKKK